MDAVFNQSSVPPFVSKLLIQHLIKSNPTPAYIQRIANVFKDNGSGVRGDLKAVVQAILLDTEARCGDTNSCTTPPGLDGHMQEPILYLLAVANGLQMQPYKNGMPTATSSLGQQIWAAPSVFSFYSPSYLVPGTNINAPEFQLFDQNYAMLRSQTLFNMLQMTYPGFGNDYRQTDWLFTFVSSPSDIIEAVNHMYYSGTMPSSTKAAINSYCQTLSALNDQQIAALTLSLNSDSFQITR